MSKVTAGRDALGDFAPKFAEMMDSSLEHHIRTAKTNGITKELPRMQGPPWADCSRRTRWNYLKRTA